MEQQSQIEYNYIYLIREREFIRLSEDVYKIGCTCQKDFKRFDGYPKSSHLILMIDVCDSKMIEKLVIKKFKGLFKHRKDIGNEYFEGDKNKMIKHILQTVEEYKPQPSDKEKMELERIKLEREKIELEREKIKLEELERIKLEREKIELKRIKLERERDELKKSTSASKSKIQKGSVSCTQEHLDDIAKIREEAVFLNKVPNFGEFLSKNYPDFLQNKHGYSLQGINITKIGDHITPYQLNKIALLLKVSKDFRESEMFEEGADELFRTQQKNLILYGKVDGLSKYKQKKLGEEMKKNGSQIEQQTIK